MGYSSSDGGVSRDIIWVSSSLEDLRRFPQPVQKVMGFALFQAQCGGRHLQAKPLKGFGGAGVLEIIEDFDGNAFRAVIPSALRMRSTCYSRSRRGPRGASRLRDARWTWCDPGCEWHRSRAEVRLAGRETRIHECRHA